MPFQISILSHWNIIKIASVGMPIVFSVWIGVFILLGVVLSFHWREYGYNVIAGWVFTALYFIIGIGFLAGMFMAKLAF